MMKFHISYNTNGPPVYTRQVETAPQLAILSLMSNGSKGVSEWHIYSSFCIGLPDLEPHIVWGVWCVVTRIYIMSMMTYGHQHQWQRTDLSPSCC